MRLITMWRSLVGSLVCLAVVGRQLPAWADERPSKGQAKRAFDHVHALAMDAEGRSLDVAAVTVNPKTPSALYAATTDAKIFRSVDGGMRWNESR